MGAVVLVAGLLPAAVFADNTVNVNATVPVSVGAHVGGDEGEGDVHMSATGTVRMDDEDRTNEDRINEDEATSSGENRHESRMKQDDQDENESIRANIDDGEIEIDQDSADNASSTIESPREVTNRGQLRSFLNHVVKSDDRIADVQVSSTTVEAHYALPSKFLWAIPANITADVTVNSNGTVSVTYPWYAFLFAKQGSELQSELSQTATSAGVGSTTFSASTQAHLLDLLFAGLKASSEK